MLGLPIQVRARLSFVLGVLIAGCGDPPNAGLHGICARLRLCRVVEDFFSDVSPYVSTSIHRHSPHGNWRLVEISSIECSFTETLRPGSKSSSPAAPLDRPSFTFIDHDDDLTSKRIKDVNARKAIRSHVMRDVRRRERLAGLKRTSRRDSRAHPVPAKSRSKVTEEPEAQSLVLRAHYRSPASSSVVETEPGDHLVGPKQQRGRPLRWSAGYPLSSHLNPNPRSLPTSWFFDPFCSLPGTFELPSMVAHLVYYCQCQYLVLPA